MPRLPLLIAVTVLALPGIAPAQAAPAPLTLLGPKNDHSQSSAKDVVFKVRGEPNEAGTLFVEVATEDANDPEPGANGGLYDEESPYFVGTFKLRPIEPGSDTYTARWAQDGGSGYTFRWHAYRELPAGSCDPDCFQETRERWLTLNDDFSNFGSGEPRNNRRGGAMPIARAEDEWLSGGKDVDWYRFRTDEARKLNMVLFNHGNLIGWPPIDYTIYQRGRRRPIAEVRVHWGREKVLNNRIKADTVYFVRVRSARPKTRRDMNYGVLQDEPRDTWRP